MTNTPSKLGWIGIGRMGYAMAERLAKGGADVTVWNRTRAKAEPLAASRRQDRRPGSPTWRPATSSSSWCRPGTTCKRSHRRAAGAAVGRAGRRAWSSSARRSRSKGSAELRAMLAARGVDMLAAPVSGNAKVIKAGPAVVRLLGSAVGLRCRAAVAAHDRAGGELRRRGRARAHRQDLPQRVPRRRDPVAGRDHGAGAEGRRARATPSSTSSTRA